MTRLSRAAKQQFSTRPSFAVRTNLDRLHERVETSATRLQHSNEAVEQSFFVLAPTGAFYASAHRETTPSLARAYMAARRLERAPDISPSTHPE